MGSTSKVFLIGPGFIGGNVLDLLVDQGYEVTALVRQEKHEDNIRRLGAVPIRGEITDVELIQRQCANSDIVFQFVTGDSLPLVHAVLAGVKQRAQARKSTVYIHTSGAKVFDDGAKGDFKTDTVYHDDNRAEMDSVADDAPHRDVDLTLVHAQEELSPWLRLAIVLPPEVYGYDEKHGRLSMMFPKLTRFAIKHGYSPLIGRGLSVETQIHVFDLARGYVDVLHYLERKDADLSNPYWLCENGEEFSWKEAAEVMGNALYKAGRIPDATPRQPPKDVYSELCGVKTESYMGLNCRARAVRLPKLGWKAREKGIWESYLQDELPVLLAE